MRYFLYGWLSLTVIFSGACQATDTPATTDKETRTTAEPTRETATASVLHLPVTDTLPYPIVEDFAELAPIFSRKDGKTYVINFWATWCGPCVEELPYFEQLAEDTAGKNVEIILISLDFKRDVRTKLWKFIKNRPLDLPVIALTDAKTNVWIDQVDPEWGGAIPITIVYKNDQRQFFAEQFANYDELAAAVQSVQSQ